MVTCQDVTSKIPITKVLTTTIIIEYIFADMLENATEITLLRYKRQPLLTLDDLAAETSIQRSTLSRAERMRRRLTPSQAARIAEALRRRGCEEASAESVLEWAGTRLRLVAEAVG